MKISPYRFLFITPGCYDKGGISRYNQYQINALIDLYGQESVRVLSLFGPEADMLQPDFKVEWHGKGNDIKSKAGLVYQSFRHALMWRPDFIITSHVNQSAIGWAASKTCNAKSILNIYGLEVWARLSPDSRLGLRKSDHIISDCHATAQYVIQSGQRNADSVIVIWDCVDLEKFKPVPSRWNSIKIKYDLPDRNSSFIILTLGRIAKDAAYKGYERLLDVFQSVEKKYPHARLIFAGKGNLVDDLKKKSADYGINDKVVFTGSIDEEDMGALYSYAHLFSLISHRDAHSGEGIPLTPLEAMACGVPIIVGDQDGSREAIEEDKNGISVDPFDLPSHQSFIESLIRNEPLRLSMAESARQIATANFSYEGFRKKHEQLFNRLASDQ